MGRPRKYPNTAITVDPIDYYPETKKEKDISDEAFDLETNLENNPHVKPIQEKIIEKESLSKKEDKVLIKSIHFIHGVEHLGSRTSYNNEKCEIYLTSLGVIFLNKSGKKILIPFSNVKSAEFLDV